MTVNTTRILIETFVRKTLEELQSAPERNIRNLVDMALNFSKGRFQTLFFQNMQQMLCNEQSAYYRMVRNVANHVDHERLLQFGMNIGYNSCTLGARKIRGIEAAEGFNIPWALFLELDAGTFSEHKQAYDSLIRQGNELGIYTWFISISSFHAGLFDLLKDHQDCAFGLLCNANASTEALIDGLLDLPHVMPSVGVGENTDSICREFRKRKMLYAVHKLYSSSDMQEVLSDALLLDTQRLNAPFTVLIPDPHCCDRERNLIYDYVLLKRKEQRFPTILWDMYQDVLHVDSIVSDDSCSARFSADGFFHTLANDRPTDAWNMFSSPLKTIFANAMKKQA